MQRKRTSSCFLWSLLEVLVFFLPIAVSVAFYLPSGLLMPARIITMILFVCAVGYWLKTRELVSPIWWVIGVSTVFIIFAVITELRYRSTLSVSNAMYLVFIIITCITMAILGARKSISWAFVWGWLASAVLSGCIGTWEVLTHHHLPGNAPATYWKKEIPDFREISAFFDNPNLYACQIAVVLLILPLIWTMLARQYRWILFPFAAWQLWLLWWTFGRIALVAVLLGFIVWAMRVRWIRWVALAGGTIGLITVFIGVQPGTYLLDFFDFDQLGLEGSSIWVRARLAKSAFWTLQQTNYLGGGPGGFEHWSVLPNNPYRYQMLNNAHFGLLEVLADYGIVSLIVLLIALGAAVIAGLRGSRNGDDWGKSAGWLVAVLAIALIPLSMSHSTWLRQPLTAIQFGLIVVLLTSIRSETIHREKGAQVPASNDAVLPS